MRLRKGRSGNGSRYRYFFATDVHGSDRCFRKFLAAAEVYEADALILGGDVVGKAIVPITTEQDGHYSCLFQGESTNTDESGLDSLKAAINFNGFYPVVLTPDERERLASDEAFRDRMFDRIIGEQIAGWCDLTAERIPERIPCVITPGNDDPEEIDSILIHHERIQCPERQVVQLGPLQLASLGSTNRTPWHTHREYEESQLTEQIEEMLAGAGDDARLMFNFHCPPYDSGLDTAVQLTDDLRPVVKNGAPVEIPVGSTAVRDAVIRHQPVLGLHGHIHESHGVRKINRSICINPGSDYSAGVLKGAIVDVDHDGEYLTHLLTTG